MCVIRMSRNFCRSPEITSPLRHVVTSTVVWWRGLTVYTATLLTFALYGYLWALYCGDWARAGVNLACSAANCFFLWFYIQRQRILNQVHRLECEYLAFLLQLPGSISVSVEATDE
jgi:hypothetical protein